MHAYPLWLARGGDSASLSSNQRDAGALPVVVVIDCRNGEAGLDQTLASIGNPNTPVRTVIIGGEARADVARVECPKDLAAILTQGKTWLCALLPGDRLAPGALDAYVQAAAEADTMVIFADDDLIQADGRRTSPHFKPDWNPDLFQHHDFITGSATVRIDRTMLSSLPDEGWERVLIGRVLKDSPPPLHLRQILHHRRTRPSPVIPAKPVEPIAGPAPTVSIIVPTRNQIDLLRCCVEGVKTVDYPSFDVTIVDNDSNEPATLDYLATLEGEGMAVLRHPGAFNFSAMNNQAVESVRGDILCFLNNDVEMLDPDWLGLMVRQAMRPEIGAVGARLLYPDRSIQHAGVFLGIGGGAGHGHRFLRDGETGYFDRARLPQLVSAVTAACLVVDRRKFIAVGGFDEEQFPVAFNDVDLCLKLNQRGWQSFYEPRATLIHHESKSRGSDRHKDNRLRFGGELAALKRKWGTDRSPDPFHHPNLSPFTEQFQIAI